MQASAETGQGVGGFGILTYCDAISTIDEAGRTDMAREELGERASGARS